MNKAFLGAGLGLVVMIFVIADDAVAGRIGQRQARQQDRICQGVRSGELTRGETVRLERQQARIRQEKRCMKSDGNLTPAERLRLERMQDKASRDIYRLKHNDWER